MEEIIMQRQARTARKFLVSILLLCGVFWPLGGCGPSYKDNWNYAQKALADGQFSLARHFLVEVNFRRPRRYNGNHAPHHRPQDRDIRPLAVFAEARSCQTLPFAQQVRPDYRRRSHIS